MNRKKCEWALNNFEAYEKYHDEEWGVPVHDDQTFFEFLILETFLLQLTSRGDGWHIQ